MGMFDSVLVKCPSCGKEVEFQSKARGWNCYLNSFRVNKVPEEIALDLDSSIEECTCGTKIILKYRGMSKYVKMEIGLIGETDEDLDNIY